MGRLQGREPSPLAARRVPLRVRAKDAPAIYAHPRAPPSRSYRPRLGGPWLALLTGGYTLRLNTGPEADTVLTKASG